MASNADPRKNVTIGTMVLLNIVNLGIVAYYSFDGAVMPLFLTAKFGLTNTQIGLIQGIGKFMIMLSLFFGIYSDYTQTKSGKRRPLILLGGLISAPLIALLPHLPLVWMLIAIITIVYFGVQFAAVPYFSLIPEVVPNEKLGTANAFFSVFGGVGTLLAYVVLLAIVYKANKPLAFYCLAALHLAGTLITVFSVKEHLPKDPPKVDKLKVMSQAIGEIIADSSKYKSLFMFLLGNLFFWFGLGAFVNFFTKFIEYYANIPYEIAGYVLGVVVVVSILLAVPVGILGDKISRKGMTMFGMIVVFIGLGLGYFLIGPGSPYSGLDLADSDTVKIVATTEEFGINYDVSKVDLSGFVKEDFDPPMDVDEDEMNDKKADVMRWCLNGTLVDDEKEKACSVAVGKVLGEDNPKLAATIEMFTKISADVAKETKSVLIIAFVVIAFAAIGLTACFVIMATILPTLMPEEKLGLYMGFYSTVTGLGQLLSLTVAGFMIDATLKNPAIGYRWIFIQGCVCMLIAVIVLIKVPYIPKADEKTVTDLQKEGKVV